MQLTINESFKNLIPKLDEAELKQLEENILAYGLLDPIKATQNYEIVDGHNRFLICQKHKIEPKIEIINFTNEDQTKLWIINTQLGRRNITDFVKVELLQQKKVILEKQGLDNLKTYSGRPTQKPLSIVDKGFTPHNTRSLLADELDWSEGKVAMAQKVLNKVDEPTKQKLRDGELSINQAYKEIRRAEKKEAFTAKIKELNAKRDLPPVNNKYEVIVIDPPWDYDEEYDPKARRGVAPYPVMNLDQIEKIEIPAADDAVLWLWTTQKFLYQAFGLLDKWNFTYKTVLVWNKDRLGLGAWLRHQCEFCLLAIKGHPLWNNTTYRDYIIEQGREHSRKPEAFYQMINNICYGTKIDYFSRTKRDGWDCYGNETDKFNREG